MKHIELTQGYAGWVCYNAWTELHYCNGGCITALGLLELKQMENLQQNETYSERSQILEMAARLGEALRSKPSLSKSQVELITSLRERLINTLRNFDRGNSPTLDGFSLLAARKFFLEIQC